MLCSIVPAEPVQPCSDSPSNPAHRLLLLRWPGGYSAATDPAGATNPAKAKTRAAPKSSLRGRGTSNVEKYSSSYASLSQMPVTWLMR